MADVFLAIDPGRTTGWALSNGETGAVDLRAEDDAAALDKWVAWLAAKLQQARATLMLVERPLFTGRIRGADFTVAVAMFAHLVAWRLTIPRHEMYANQVRKAIFGKPTGHTDKVRMLKARELGWTLKNNHEADAALLLSAYCGTHALAT